MEIIHKTRTKAATGQGKGLFLLANRKGGYLLLGDNNYTHYAGLCYFLPEEWTLYKTIDDIRLDKKPDNIINKFYTVERITGTAKEKFFVFDKTLYYEVNNYHGKITIDLDMRKINNNNDWGRTYKIYWEEGFIIIEYKQGEEKTYLVIKGEQRYTLLNEWEPRRYSYDKKRGEREERWIYKAIAIECQENCRLSFTFAKNKEEAKRTAEEDYKNWELIKSRVRDYTYRVKTTDEVNYSTAVFALESFITTLNHGINRTGLFAGYPWFHQYWSRDEIISLRGLILAEKYYLAKEIIENHLKNIRKDGRIPNRQPSTGIGSADATLWLWKRIGDFIKHLEEEKLLWDYYTKEELDNIREKIRESIKLIRENYEKEGLITNGPQETWMDTTGGTNDNRAGARIEIQALMLASLKTLRKIDQILKKNNNSYYKNYEKELSERTKKEFFKEGKLWDGNNDSTQRPNIFIAYYAYPELLSKKEWKQAFNNALKELWLDWGGIASISKKHPLYQKRHTGNNDKSYHRGDSWYWVNNIAGIALQRTDPEEYEYYIKSIKNASTRELLWGGIAGQSAELSSAEEQTSEGCLAQAWSAATLIELLWELEK